MKDQVIDMLFVVDDTYAFHNENMNINYAHYSYFTKRLPLSFTNELVQNKGSKMFFHPLIPLSSFEGFLEKVDPGK